MCVDYTNLNRSCPKDPFALSRTDQVIDSTAGSESMCFLDAYSSYNQIKMSVEDQEKTSFIRPFGAYCYMAISFGLKNAGATYQRCMQRCLDSQIGHNVHVYVDDVVIKSARKDDLIADLEETFANLRRYQINLNPLKCVFDVPAGMLLGFIVSERGIEANPEKISAIAALGKPTCLRDVQKPVGRVAPLSRFIPRLGEKAMALYSLLKKSNSFVWTDDADQALVTLKQALQEAPILAIPKDKEPMLLYIAATNRVVSTIMVVERHEEGKEHPVQRPVYYLSDVVTESKQRYPQYQKLVYALFRAQRRLRHYFQEQPIKVVSASPLPDIIRNRDATGQVTKWAVEIGVHNITYEPRKAIKTQALADFFVDWAETQQPTPQVETKHWTLFFDGSKNIEATGAGIDLISPKGDKLRYVLQLTFEPCTNNVAEYEALLHGM
jgi:hypothetical protein